MRGPGESDGGPGRKAGTARREVSGPEMPAVLEACLACLRQAPAGLITDVDGTISQLAPTPEAARVSERIRDSLRRLERRLHLVAVVSGRSAADARRLVRVEGIVCVGNHGMETLDAAGPSLDPSVAPYVERVAAARAALEPALRRRPGVVVEDKGATLAIHYRRCPDPEVARREIIRLAGVHAAGLRPAEGKMVVELRPPVQVSKGTALRRLVDSRGLRGVVFLGDDRTDVDALVEVRRLAADRRLAALGVAVAGPETPPEVLAAADLVVGGVEEVEELLSGLADELEGGRA